MAGAQREVTVGVGRWIGRGAGGLLVLAAAAAGWDMATYDARAWAADFERLKRDMAQGYANLDWMASRRGLDLRGLAARTEYDLAPAGSRIRAFRTIRAFVEAFDDPHLRIESKQQARPATGGTGPAPDPPAGADCAAAGYEEADHGFAFPFASLPGWRPLADGSFPAGIAGQTGVLRIAQFAEKNYLAACTAAFRPGVGERALQLDTRRELQKQIEARIATLKAAGARRILVDLTGNGGGSEWVQEALVLFTGRRLVRAARWMAFPACDRFAIWGGDRVCPGLSPPTETVRAAGTGAWTGPVLILVDRGTASAAEDFAVWLEENGVAQVAGERTAGAGCGYVNGGNVTRFAASPFQVKMPNCARFTKDGFNEVEGLAPDIPLPMGRPEAAAALATLLRQ